MTQAVNPSNDYERLERLEAAMRMGWKSGVPVRRWSYARTLTRLLFRAGHT